MAIGGNLRDSEIVEFLARAGWEGATRTPLNADASTRRYERLRRRGETAMLMDAPRLESPPCPPGADDEARLAMGWNAISRLAASRVEAFAAVGGHLSRRGLSSPGIRDLDIPRGLALLEDLGDDLFARVLERGENETTLYAAAGEVLAAAHRAPAPFTLPYPGGEWPVLTYDHLALSANVDLFVEWMPRRDVDMRITDSGRLRWEGVRENLIAMAEDFPRALILRDTHAENLIWLPGRDGVRRVGLLDFQDAVLGWGEWDMSMLLHDARRDVTPAARASAIRAYLDGTGGMRTEFDRRMSVLGAMNIMRIMGIFARLVVRDGKPRYDTFQPRLRGLLAETLSHPALSQTADFVNATAPHLLAAA
ncbi:MAG: phosphotransferase [Alphaproteobacteria bacterium]|nr:phosphotransferase [Alphaproteobacteria bacterium]